MIFRFLFGGICDRFLEGIHQEFFNTKDVQCFYYQIYLNAKIDVEPSTENCLVSLESHSEETWVLYGDLVDQLPLFPYNRGWSSPQYRELIDPGTHNEDNFLRFSVAIPGTDATGGAAGTLEVEIGISGGSEHRQTYPDIPIRYGFVRRCMSFFLGTVFVFETKVPQKYTLKIICFPPVLVM